MILNIRRENGLYLFETRLSYAEDTFDLYKNRVKLV